MRGPVVLPLAPGEAPAATSDLRLRGYWLLIARFAWVMVALACLAVIVGSIHIDLGLLQTACAGASCVEAQQPTASGAKVHNQVGLSLDAHGVLSLSVTGLAACVWFGAALVIVWRKSDEWVALLVAGMLVLQGTNTIINPAQEVPSFWQFPATFLSYLGFVLTFLALLLFPEGRFRPRWTRWLVIVWGVFMVWLFCHLPTSTATLFCPLVGKSLLVPADYSDLSLPARLYAGAAPADEMGGAGCGRGSAI